MFTYLKLKNFQSLTDFEIDFMKNQKTPINLALIYGENGVGKTNLTNAFFMLQESFRTMKINETVKKIASEEIDNINFNKYIEKLKKHYPDTRTIEKKYKTFDCEDKMSLEFGFMYNDKNGRYIIEYSNGKIVYELLEYTLHKRMIKFLEMEEGNVKIGNEVFISPAFKRNFKKQLDKYWPDNSFISIFDYEFNDKKLDNMKETTSVIFLNLYNYLTRISVKVRNQKNEYGVLGLKKKILRNFLKGRLPIDEEVRVETSEKLLNYLLTSFYSHIQLVYYEKEYIDDSVKYELFVKKLVNGKVVDSSITNESTGILRMLGIIPYILSLLEGNIVIIDEADLGIHDVIVHSLITNINDFINSNGNFSGQLITTTQNTYLLESSLLKENFYMFNSDCYGNKEVYPLTVFTEKTHTTFNIRKRYLNGLYGAVPYTKDINFEKIMNVDK